MPADMPPQIPVPAIIAPAPECRYVTNSEAQVALERLRHNLRGTEFVSAKPSAICGLVWVKMARGTVVYTDPTGRFLLLTFALDTHRGAPADVESELEHAIESREAFPEKAIPGVMPSQPPEN